MAQRRLVFNSVIALVAVVLSGGVAAVAVVGQLPSEPPSELVATVYDVGESVRIPPGAIDRSLTPLDTASDPPATTATAATPIVTGPSVPETTFLPQPPSPPPTWGPDSIVPVLPPPGPAAPSPPVVDPSSWRLEENGITITARIEPALPRVGNTVTISYTTAAEGDFCCWSHVLVDGAVVDEHLFPPGDGCPKASEGSWTTTVVVTEPGPFTFQVQGNSWENLCVGPPVYFNANLFATFDVLAAA